MKWIRGHNGRLLNLSFVETIEIQKTQDGYMKIVGWSPQREHLIFVGNQNQVSGVMNNLCEALEAL